MQAENKFISNTLGWQPVISFEKGLEISVEWYKKFLKLYFGKKSQFKDLLY